MFAERLAAVIETRATRPEAIAEAAARRVRRPSLLGERGRLLIIAADHPARGALRAGPRPLAMGDRADLLQRLCTALDNPSVDGVLGTPDIVEDLLLLGALDRKVVIGSMNRTGLEGAVFGIDDRFTAYDADGIVAERLDGGKMLLRIDPADPATPRTMEGCARAVTGLAAAGRMALVEPFWAGRDGGRLRNILEPEAMIKAIGIASGLGATSAYTWLKVPVVDDMERVMAASTLPALLLGGAVPEDPAETLAGWQKALRLPTVRGLIVGRSLLYPYDDDVGAAVEAAAGLL
jgi:hypothetical protein